MREKVSKSVRCTQKLLISSQDVVWHACTHAADSVPSASDGLPARRTDAGVDVDMTVPTRLRPRESSTPLVPTESLAPPVPFSTTTEVTQQKSVLMPSPLPDWPGAPWLDTVPCGLTTLL